MSLEGGWYDVQASIYYQPRRTRWDGFLLIWHFVGRLYRLQGEISRLGELMCKPRLLVSASPTWEQAI